MKKYTQKELRGLVELGAAVDISHADNAKRDELEQADGYLSTVGYSQGVHGCNGKLLKGRNSGRLYAIVGRTQALFVF